MEIFAAQILCEIKFGSFWVSKTDILTFFAGQNLETGEYQHFQMWNFLKNQNSGPPKW